MRNDNQLHVFVRLTVVVAMPALLAACLGMGSSGPTPASAGAAPKTATQKASAEAAAQNQVGSAADLNVDGVPMLEMFRKKPVGKGLGKVDDVYAERSAQLALEYDQDGVARGWTNPDTGTTGAVKPVRTFKQAETYCREFEQTLQIRQRGSKDVKGQADAKGQVACRQPDGKWKFLP